MSVTFTNNNPTGFVILKRDAAELHLTLVKGHRAGLHNVAHLMVADAAALHEHLVANGARIVKGLRDADYGEPGMIGYTLPEIRRLLISLIQARAPGRETVWSWSRWRRRRPGGDTRPMPPPDCPKRP